MRRLIQRKARQFWSSAVYSFAGDSKAIWSKVNAPLSPSAVASSSDNLSGSVDQFATHFTLKVQTINTSMAHAQPPLITSRTLDTKLSTFRPVSDDEVRKMLSKSKAEHCDLGLTPT
jgi:hypothetical protein